jgi:DNA-directed RNA polymerase subunit RPC12/RpoP
MLTEITVIKCELCNKEIIQANAAQLAGFNSDDIILARVFQSLVPVMRDPKSGDKMACPYCGYDYSLALRKQWRIEKKKRTKKEWDE